jgi:hypothetical protein
MIKMNDHRSDKVKAVCGLFINIGCSDTCPLASACKPHAFDTKEVFDARINHAAEILTNDKGG